MCAVQFFRGDIHSRRSPRFPGTTGASGGKQGSWGARSSRPLKIPTGIMRSSDNDFGRIERLSPKPVRSSWSPSFWARVGRNTDPPPPMHRGRLSRYRIGVRILCVSPIDRLCWRPARAPRRIGRTEAAARSTPLSGGGIEAEDGADAPILVCEREPDRTPSRPRRLHRIGMLMRDRPPPVHFRHRGIWCF